MVAACATPGPPAPYHFQSNLAPDDAMGCVSRRLRLEGFDLTSPADSSSAVAPDSSSTVVPDSIPTVPPDSSTLAPDSRSMAASDSNLAIALGGGSAVALRSTPTEEVGGREWWRLEILVSIDEEGGTVVQSVAGVAPRAEGPYQAPSVALQGLVGKLTASCTW